ncbi:hypothetical protein HRG_006880 [Hirsutella rhossiliensis]|uniref:Uncharacterized protein n=1 Tax=Hirsutella rhossiliensis TaxID=111463 RepID=A0A9P8MV49_9HYPO|nr:uncharacterized protein HRG_06880 [Hirsutella rhossiliensis]KAH0961800.1 hypothetical protein HRG_06880 [Hirsutella rhossiliensis]
MKSLMPLALSPSCSSLWSASSAEEPVGERVDDYFPELLARDLELSARVFASKRMTAGTPISTLSSEDRERHRSCRMVPSLPYLAASARVQSLGPIEERTSRVSFLNPQGLSRLDDNASDLDSRSTAQASDYTGPPSIRPRESVMTMATSLASTNWKTSLKSPPPSDGLLESSWIDGDSDGEDQDDDLNHGNMDPMAPRPPTPPESDRASGVPAVKIDVRGHWGYNETPLHRKSHSVSGGSPVAARRKLSGGSLDVPLRPASTAGVRGLEGREPRESSQAPNPVIARKLFPSSEEEVRSHRPRRSTGVSQRTRKKALHINLVAEPSPVSDEFPDRQDDITPPPALQAYPPPNSNMDPQSHLPRPALRNVQSWLNGSLQPYPRSLQSEDLTKVVPLPPDAMETLRVSIACFPETMLLSSSLTIETIRTYSRKVRQPSIELLRNLPVRSPSPESPTQPGRKSLWRKVVPYRKGCDAPEPKQRYQHSGANSVDSTTSCSVSPPKPWEPLKHVFGCCSDYICDALYAHILAYNYVSALVARNPQAAAKAGRGFANAPHDSQQEDIPKKAASLLGLAGAGGAAAAGFSRLTRRLATPLGSWTKEEMITSQPTAAANHENMQHDLLRCISRLVATAKLVAEGGAGDETMINTDVEDTDIFFVRSLCEIVRIAEEAS